MQNNNVKLKSMTCADVGDSKSLEFLVSHNNGRSTVKQEIVVESLNGKWIAKIAMDDIPPQATAKEAAHKLGDWLVRLGQSINEESKQFESIEL